MILRSFFSLCVGAVIACAVPAFRPVRRSGNQSQTASAASATPDAAALKATTLKAPVAKKPKAKSAAKKTTKKVAKAKKPATDVATDDDEGGFFSRLFGGGIKKRSQVDAKVKAKPVQIEDDPTLPQITSNDGELRSEAQEPSRGRSVSPRMLPETRALDRVLEKKQAKKQFKVRPEFMPQEVDFSGYNPGTIVIDTNSKFLYLVKNRSTARRYAIAVGREGLQFKGNVTVGDKQEWPRWIPTFDMQKREPWKYGRYKDGMDGGPDNPLGARAIYLFEGKHDTHLRIHGTNQPQSIGSAASNGCFRMINDHVIDLYTRVKLGAPVVVL